MKSKIKKPALERDKSQRFSVSLITQGKHQFYTFTMYSDVLAQTCFVTTAEEDPEKGFQRVLDPVRAQEIAEYIDSGIGTIPTSIVLSAQSDAEFKVVDKGKTVEFKPKRKAFLVLDGQHRVYGFSKSKTRLRIPVVVYNGLSRKDETRLFIDINTKQRPVPSELLLAIKKLADYETDIEKTLNELFIKFNNESSSPLLGLLSSTSKQRGKISRVTFYSGVKSLHQVFDDSSVDEVYDALSGYIQAFKFGCTQMELPDAITNPTIFKAAMLLFKDTAQRVKDRYDGEYTWSNFWSVLSPMFDSLKSSYFRSPGKSHVVLHEVMSSKLRQRFTL